MRSAQSPRLLKPILGTAVVLSFAFGINSAFGLIPDSNNVFHACVVTRTGAVRMIDTEQGQTCRQGENAVHWNQNGGGANVTLQTSDTVQVLQNDQRVTAEAA